MTIAANPEEVSSEPPAPPDAEPGHRPLPTERIAPSSPGAPAELDAMEPGSRDAETGGERQAETEITTEVRGQRSEAS